MIAYHRTTVGGIAQLRPFANPHSNLKYPCVYLFCVSFMMVLRDIFTCATANSRLTRIQPSNTRLYSKQPLTLKRSIL